MQLLLIHSDYLEYEAKKTTPVAEEIDEDRKKGRMEETLVAFIAVESVDEKNPDEIVSKAAGEIRNVASQVKSNNIVLYPYAHLSSDLGSPKVAVKILKDLEKELSTDLNVMRAPFGWYKAFNISCKGHPLSELSRTIVPEGEAKVEGEVVSEALEAERKIVSHWYVMTPDGELTDPDAFNFTGYDNLRLFFDYEISKSRAVDRVPPHVELMRRFELADYESASDPGNLRYYPNGRLVKSLLEEYVLSSATEYGAMEVETPIMYDMDHPTLKKYLDRFPARQYSIESDKRNMFLRFAACFGQFLMNHDMTIIYKSLPLKMIELTRYSFRREQRGELVGLRRLRSFTMPDMHTLSRDMDQAIDEFVAQYDMCIRVLDDVGLSLDDYEVAIRCTSDFYNEHPELLKQLVSRVNKPVLIETWDERFFYFVLKFEFNFVDALEKASALSTVQIDVENAERYDISFVDEDNSKQRPIILHCSPSGAIERCMYALLEKGSMDAEREQVPMLPVWLSPTQLRLIPVADRHLSLAERIGSELDGVRVDIDDRDETVGKKIRSAGKEWIPYVGVIGDEEVEDGTVTVTIRSESEPDKPLKVKLTPSELHDRIRNEIEGLPFKPLSIPAKLSERSKFI